MSNSNNVGLNGRRHMKPSFKKYLGYKFFKELVFFNKIYIV